jgi:prophage regulatory protein
MSEQTLPDVGYVRLPTVLRVIPIGKTSWWEGVRKGRYPKPVKLGPNTTAWRVEDIRALIGGCTILPGDST